MARWEGFFGGSLAISSHRKTKGKAVSSRTSTPFYTFSPPHLPRQHPQLQVSGLCLQHHRWKGGAGCPSSRGEKRKGGHQQGACLGASGCHSHLLRSKPQSPWRSKRAQPAGASRGTWPRQGLLTSRSQGALNTLEQRFSIWEKCPLPLL